VVNVGDLPATTGAKEFMSGLWFRLILGDRVKNKLTQDLFKITKIENERVVMLEDEKGLVRIWFPKQHLGSFFEEVKGR
jgi:hypothetical protein